MDKNEFLEMVKQIGTIEDEVERRSKLTELTDSVSAVFDSNIDLMEKNKKYEDDNEKLRSANMQLFLKVGSGKTEQEIKNDSVGKIEEESQPRKFEDLFDDKGNLKVN